MLRMNQLWRIEQELLSLKLESNFLTASINNFINKVLLYHLPLNFLFTREMKKVTQWLGGSRSRSTKSGFRSDFEERMRIFNPFVEEC